MSHLAAVALLFLTGYLTRSTQMPPEMEEAASKALHHIDEMEGTTQGRFL